MFGDSRCRRINSDVRHSRSSTMAADIVGVSALGQLADQSARGSAPFRGEPARRHNARALLFARWLEVDGAGRTLSLVTSSVPLPPTYATLFL